MTSHQYPLPDRKPPGAADLERQRIEITHRESENDGSKCCTFFWGGGVFSKIEKIRGAVG